MILSQTVAFSDCSLDATGVLVDGRSKQVFVDTTGWYYASVEVVEKNAVTGTTWRVKVQRANKRPFRASGGDFASGATMQNTTWMSGQLTLDSQFLLVTCTTAESGKTVDVYIHLRTNGV